MEKAVNVIVGASKLLVFGGGIFASVVIFIHTLASLEPRITKTENRLARVEERLSAGESRMSTIEVKLDELLIRSGETRKDVKDIYYLMLKSQ